LKIAKRLRAEEGLRHRLNGVKFFSSMLASLSCLFLLENGSARGAESSISASPLALTAPSPGNGADPQQTENAGILRDGDELKSIEPRFDSSLGTAEPAESKPMRLLPASLQTRFVSLGDISPLNGYSRVLQAKIVNQIDSKSAQIGGTLKAELLEDFQLGSIKVAHRGAILIGRILDTSPARTLAQSAADQSRRFRSRGCLRIGFDEIVDTDGRRLQITGLLVKQSTETVRTIASAPGKTYQRQVKVDKQGRIVKSERVLSVERQRTYNAVRVATMAPIPIPGNFILTNFVGVPIALGAAGAADPSFAFNKPVDEETENPRLKGFTYAFLTNLPGAAFVQAFTERGNEIVLQPGDQIAVSVIIGRSQEHNDSSRIAVNQLVSTESYSPDSDKTILPKLILPDNGANRLVPSPDLGQSASRAGTSKQVRGVLLIEPKQ
jgi:hypothetical protein